jgi:peptidoglycan hydrolase-like protein with peptidoglycan-binding domain
MSGEHPNTETTVAHTHRTAPSTTTTARPTTTTSTAPAATTAPVAPLALGSTGPLVYVLQEQLTSLGYWLGTPDGTFGDSTQQAVYALQKVAGITPDGVVGSATQAALSAGVRPQPRPASGYVIEIDLQHDLLMFVTDGKLDAVLNTSTGGGYTYSDGGRTAVAETPTGHFTVFREVDGLVTDSLGQLWRPKFFYEGFAIHGDSYVPPRPVSHGCVRVSNEAINWIWADNLAPIGTSVWVFP